MSNIKLGDLVVVIHVPGGIYPALCEPGSVFNVNAPCNCWCGTQDPPRWHLANAYVPIACAHEIVLRRIDPDGREKVEWDWREMVTKETA